MASPHGRQLCRVGATEGSLLILRPVVVQWEVGGQQDSAEEGVPSGRMRWWPSGGAPPLLEKRKTFTHFLIRDIGHETVSRSPSHRPCGDVRRRIPRADAHVGIKEIRRLGRSRFRGIIGSRVAERPDACACSCSDARSSVNADAGAIISRPWAVPGPG